MVHAACCCCCSHYIAVLIASAAGGPPRGAGPGGAVQSDEQAAGPAARLTPVRCRGASGVVALEAGGAPLGQAAVLLRAARLFAAASPHAAARCCTCHAAAHRRACHTPCMAPACFRWSSITGAGGGGLRIPAAAVELRRCSAHHAPPASPTSCWRGCQQAHPGPC